MSAPHFFLDAIGGDVLRITGDDARHAVRALRLSPGEAITIADGAGAVAACRVREVLAGRDPVLVAEVLDRTTAHREPPALVVYPALPKAGKLDLVVRKLTEIGVASIRPWRAARSVPRWDDAKAGAQTDRLRAIAREAAMQSRRPFFPEVRPPADPEDLPGCTFVLHEEATVRLRAVLPAAPPEAVGLIVGPEGGLAAEEVARLAARGAAPVGLGVPVLRAETAAIVSATIVAWAYGLLG